MQEGFDLAQKYVNECVELRDALDIESNAEGKASLSIEPLANGEHNSNFVLRASDGRRWVLRINYVSVLGIDAQVEYEAEALEQLASSGVVPRVAFVDTSKKIIDHGVLIESFCEGNVMDYYQSADVEGSLALLAQVHGVAPSAACGLRRLHKQLAEQFEECCGYIETYAGFAEADARVLARLESFRDLVARNLYFDDEAADRNHIINTEAVAEHFLLTRQSGGASIGSMVDWEKPIIGEVAQDVAYFLSPTTTIWSTEFVFSRAARESAVEMYWRAVAGRFARGNFDDRFDAYLKSNCLRGLTWSANAIVEYSDPNRPLKNERTRNKLEQYLCEDFLDFCARDVFGC